MSLINIIIFYKINYTIFFSDYEDWTYFETCFCRCYPLIIFIIALMGRLWTTRRNAILAVCTHT